MRIVENAMLTIPGPEDWSRVRSPSRARRRQRYGHRQNVVFTVLPDPNFYVCGDVTYCHPVLAKKLRTAMAEKAEQHRRNFDQQLSRVLSGLF